MALQVPGVGRVFPTRVGVFPSPKPHPCFPERFPHASGGVSYTIPQSRFSSRFSPREWGCFFATEPITGTSKVFPTRVGVFLGLRLFLEQDQKFSPREWGCFLCSLNRASACVVFPTRVGVFLRQPILDMPGWQFSPREWGCFSHQAGHPLQQSVFPTRVGVFLFLLTFLGVCPSFPHASGGVSPSLPDSSRTAWFSPREWGCFYYNPQKYPHLKVFPTRVGVFLARSLRIPYQICFPHASGGVSPPERRPTRAG